MGAVEVFKQLGVEPFDYQISGAEFLAGPNRFYYLADAPGLGKTLQTIVAAALVGAQSVLVLCPAAITGQWSSQLKQFKKRMVVSYESLSLSPVKKHTNTCFLREKPPPVWPKGKDEPAPICKGCGYNFPRPDVIQRKQKALMLRRSMKDQGPWDVIVFDESHMLKERSSNRTSYILHSSYGIVNSAKKGIHLSGTPILNRPAELYPVLRACFPGVIHDCPHWEQYVYKFCDGGPGWNGSLDSLGASNLDELGRRLQPYMLARDETVLGDRLPPLHIIDQDIEIERVISKADHIATRRRETGEAKVEQLVESIARVAAEAGKLVVFYYHNSVRVALQQRFPHAPIIKGGMTSLQKAAAVERFNKLAFASVMLVQLTSGGVGLDGLQHCASTGYIAELDWTPALLKQAIGRLRRLGQKHPVTIHRPIGHKQGLDLHIRGLLHKKQKVIDGVMDFVTVRPEKPGMVTIQDVIDQGKALGKDAVSISLDELAIVASREGHIMADTAVIELLEKLNSNIERLIEVTIDAGKTTTTRKRSQKKADTEAETEADVAETETANDDSVDVAVSTATQPQTVPAQAGMTHDEAKSILTGEIEADDAKADERYAMFTDELAKRGVTKLMNLPEDQLESFVAALQTRFSGVQPEAKAKREL